MDLDLWIRLLREGEAARVPNRLAQFRVHMDAKSSQLPWRYYRETLSIALKYQLDQPWTLLMGRCKQIGFHLAKEALGLHRSKRVNGKQKRKGWYALSVPTNKSWCELLDDEPARSPDVAATLLLNACDTYAELAASSAAQLVVMVDNTSQLPRRRDAPIYRRSAFFLCKGEAERSTLREVGVPSFRLGDVDERASWQRAAQAAHGTPPCKLALEPLSTTAGRDI